MANIPNSGVPISGGQPPTPPWYSFLLDMARRLETAISAAGVTSFNSRTGDVAPAAGDYSASEITNDSSVTGTNVDDALDQLASDISAIDTPTTEEIQDLVGAMFSGNTETNITVTYQDTDGTIDLAVPSASATAAGVVELATNAETSTGTDATRAVTPAGLASVYTASDVLTKIKTVDGTGSGLDADTLDGNEASAFAAASHSHASTDITDFAEAVSDQVGGMVTGNTETFISVTYQDADNTLDFAVPVKDEDDMASDSDAHLATQQSIKAYIDANAVTFPQLYTSLENLFVMNTETFISVIYRTEDDTIDFVVPVLDEDDMSSDSASHLATQQSIKAYVDAQVGSGAASGTYTPTGYAVTNVDSVTPGQAMYQRNGNVVTVSGYVELNMTAAGGAYTRADLSLPIASNFVNSLDLSGVATAFTGDVCGIQANATNDRVQIESSATVTTTVPYRYVYQYVIK